MLSIWKAYCMHWVDKYLNFSLYNNQNVNLITDKKSAVCDNDDRSSCTASTCRTTIRKRRLQVKRNLFEDKKGKSTKRILIDLGQIDKMNMVHQYVLDSSKVMADVQKPKTEMDFCKDLLGDENREIIDVIKYQIRLEKYPGNRSFQSSLDIAMAKLQTAISKEHNTLKKVFLESKYNPKISGKLKKAEILLKKWKIYFF
ncbi:unnamed protein product [Mytilus coruscus]|uniref:Uncharacterized protein n=1 Tax=Mytilus coruscus TaxID=42192 RepID=A0A6J8E270_MYTCO|nr:unnamed protein product [Mytilus coruscus]